MLLSQQATAGLFRPRTFTKLGCWHAAQIAGNDWTIPSLRLVLLVGMVSSLVPTVLSFLFSDDKSLGAQSEGLLANHRKDQAEAGAALPLDAIVSPSSAPSSLVREPSLAPASWSGRPVSSAGQVSASASSA